MHPLRSSLSVIALAPLLGACVSAGSAPVLVPSSGSNTTAQRPAPPPITRSPRPIRMAGLDGVIGASAGQLVRRFGTPQLDIVEGDARKLQFAGEACVLDIFLYPPREGAAETATHIEARRASDGRDVDRAACVSALSGR